jgi:hypothetical protein
MSLPASQFINAGVQAEFGRVAPPTRAGYLPPTRTLGGEELSLTIAGPRHCQPDRGVCAGFSVVTYMVHTTAAKKVSAEIRGFRNWSALPGDDFDPGAARLRRRRAIPLWSRPTCRRP